MGLGVGVGMGEVRFISFLLVWFGFGICTQADFRMTDDNDGGTEGGYPKPPPLPIPSMIDIYTPAEAKTRKGFDGQAYELVFSDEFEVDGRSFYKGASKSFFWVFEFLFACFWRCFFGDFFFFSETWALFLIGRLSYLIFYPPSCRVLTV